MTDADWEWHFAPNFMSAVRANRAARPSLIERRGVTLNISSINASSPGTSIHEYMALKAAPGNFTQTLALELAPKGPDGGVLADRDRGAESRCQAVLARGGSVQGQKLTWTAYMFQSRRNDGS